MEQIQLYRNLTYFLISLLAREIFLGTSVSGFGKHYLTHLKDLFPFYTRTSFNPFSFRGVKKLSLVVSATMWQICEISFLSFPDDFAGTFWMFSFSYFSSFVCYLKLSSTFLYILFASNICIFSP